MKPLHNLVLVKRLSNGSARRDSIIIRPDTEMEQLPWAEVLEVNNGQTIEGKHFPSPFKKGQIVFVRQWCGVPVDLNKSKWESRLLVNEEQIEAIDE